MSNEYKKTTDNQAIRTTRSGSKLFDGSEGNTFTSTNQPTPEQKSAGWAKRRAREEFINRIYGKINELSKRKDLTNKEIIDLAKIAIDISGDKVKGVNIKGDVEVQKVYITPEQDKAVDDHITEVINDKSS